MKKETLDLLKKLAKEPIQIYEEDWVSEDYGNYDDCWDCGMNDGRRELARDILTLEGISHED